jgi:hypothetical protein
MLEAFARLPTRAPITYRVQMVSSVHGKRIVNNRNVAPVTSIEKGKDVVVGFAEWIFLEALTR